MINCPYRDSTRDIQTNIPKYPSSCSNIDIVYRADTSGLKQYILISSLNSALNQLIELYNV